ncbi:hypothetical protein OG601_42990 [Streptomyces sp. NBC_01239]|nr:hypothetical protein [Streptomyces sp. NBC_01239]MCX4817366.1 hypothetical protein [Streptomyces sp. NBC_01239]
MREHVVGQLGRLKIQGSHGGTTDGDPHRFEEARVGVVEFRTVTEARK